MATGTVSPYPMTSRLATALLLFLPLAAAAQSSPSPQPFFNVVTLETSATSEVPSDTLAVTLFTEEQGPDPAQLAARANTRLEQALATAKSEPGVEAHSGAYQTMPLYDRASQITGWRVRAELVLEGRDFKVVSALAGRLQPSMKLAGMAFSLSRGARERAEASLLTEALHKFQAKADAIAKTLGFPGYTLGQLSVRSEGSPPIQPVALRAMAQVTDGGDPSPPMEGGKNAVTLVVSGSVVLGPAK
jgi:predicted secreted protein